MQVKTWNQLAREFDEKARKFDELEQEMIAQEEELLAQSLSDDWQRRREETYFGATSTEPRRQVIDWIDVRHGDMELFKSLIVETTALAWEIRQEQQKLEDEWALAPHLPTMGELTKVTEKQARIWNDYLPAQEEYITFEVENPKEWENELFYFEKEAAREAEEREDQKNADLSFRLMIDEVVDELEEVDAMSAVSWKHAQRRQRDKAAMHRKLRLATHHGFWPAKDDDFDCPTWTTWSRYTKWDRYEIPGMLGGYQEHHHPQESSQTAITEGYKEWLEEWLELTGMMTSWHGKPATGVPLSKRVRKTRAQIKRADEKYERLISSFCDGYINWEYFYEKSNRVCGRLERLNFGLERLEQERKTKKAAAKKRRFGRELQRVQDGLLEDWRRDFEWRQDSENLPDSDEYHRDQDRVIRESIAMRFDR